MSTCSESPLEWLLLQIGGKYLSDLRPEVRPNCVSRALRAALAGAPRDQWTNAQWSAAATYLLGSAYRLDDNIQAFDNLRALL